MSRAWVQIARDWDAAAAQAEAFAREAPAAAPQSAPPCICAVLFGLPAANAEEEEDRRLCAAWR